MHVQLETCGRHYVRAMAHRSPERCLELEVGFVDIETLFVGIVVIQGTFAGVVFGG